MSSQAAPNSLSLGVDGREQIFMSNEMFLAMQTLRENDLARRAFQLIRQASGTLSGWDLARALEIGPDSAREVLQKLKAVGVIKSSGEDLEGYYYLADLGFKLRLMQAA